MPPGKFPIRELFQNEWNTACSPGCDRVRVAMGAERIPDPVPGLLAPAAERLRMEFASLPDFVPHSCSPKQTSEIAAVLEETAHRLGDNFPYFHPMYAGQMLKPPHPIARAAYALAMAINPNNHARDGGRASSVMEIDAVAGIASMLGWTAPNFLGHLTSSGT